MGNLKIGHVVEAALWLALAGVLYAYSFRFDQPIEIYKFGASNWPRAVLLLIVIAALGQLAFNWKTGGRGAAMLEAAADDGAEAAARAAHHTGADAAGVKWYAATFGILALPFVYILLPGWLTAGDSQDALHTVKLSTAAAVVTVYIIARASTASARCWRCRCCSPRSCKTSVFTRWRRCSWLR